MKKKQNKFEKDEVQLRERKEHLLNKKEKSKAALEKVIIYCSILPFFHFIKNAFHEIYTLTVPVSFPSYIIYVGSRSKCCRT